MTEEDQFSSFLEKYSEYLTDASNKDDLLQFGRHLFASSSSDADNRESIRLLREKENELNGTANKQETNTKPSYTTRTTRLQRTIEPPQNLSPEQVTAEILQLQENGEALRQRKKDLESKLQDLQKQYEKQIYTSIETKNNLNKEMRRLTRELADSLLRSSVNTDISPNVPRILPVMNELEKLNQQILQKIGNFRETTRDALAHCERAALDRYKPRMEELLNKIYENSRDVPIDEIQRRYDAHSEELETHLIQLQSELAVENGRNEKLQFDTRQLEDRVSAQRDEVARMKKQHSQLGNEITLLNNIAVQEISSLKAQYQRLLLDQEEEKAKPSSARAVIVTGKGTKEIKTRSLKRTPSKTPLKPMELKNPMVPSIEEFIDQEKALLLERIHNTQYV